MKPSVINDRGMWLLFAVTALTYARGLTGEFVWDDVTFFVENDILPNLKPWDLRAIFLYPVSYWGENLPLSELVFVLEHFAFGSFTPAYHLVSLLLYLCVGWLAWIFVSNIYREVLPCSGRGGNDAPAGYSVLLVMALFLFHPVHVEVAAYITGQQHLLSVMFSLSALNLFWLAWKNDKLGHAGYVIGAAGCYYLAVLAKYQAVATGLFIPLLWLMLRGKGGASTVKVLSGWAALNIPVALWLGYATRAYTEIGQTGAPFLHALATGIRILGAHVLIALKPFPLNFGYPFEPGRVIDIDFLAGVAVLGALAVTLVFFRRSVVAIGLVIFVVYLFPVLQIFVEVSNAGVFDRYLFLPVLGLCLVFERSVERMVAKWPTLKWLILPVCVSLVISYLAITSWYIPKFQSNLASTRHAYATYPDWNRTAFGYVTELIEAGHLDEAEVINASDKTLSDPAWVRDYFAGWIELERGRVPEAILLLRRSAILARTGGYFPFAGVPLGTALMRAGKTDEARFHLESVLTARINQPVEKYRAKKLLEAMTGG